MKQGRLLAQRLLLAQKIYVGVAAGTGIDDGGKVPGEVVCIPADVSKSECKWNFQRSLGRPNQIAVFP